MELRPGVRAAYLVRRRLWLQGVIEGGAEAVEDRLRGLVGFNRLSCSGNRLLLEYDAGHLQIDTVLSALDEAGVDLAGSYGHRFRLGWYRFGDANVRTHSRDTASTCCSQSPLRYR